MKREASGKKFSLKFGFQSLNKGKKNSPNTVKKIEPTAAKNKSCNSVKGVNSIKRIDVPTINRSNLAQDSKIAVCGLGCIGFSVVTLLSYFGYKNIIATDLYNLRVFNANEVDSVRAYSNWESFTDALKEFHGEGEIFGIPVSNTDVFIDCTGNHKLISNIINISKKHARIVITGLHQEQALIDFRAVLMRELEITCSMAYSNQ